MLGLNLKIPTSTKFTWQTLQSTESTSIIDVLTDVSMSMEKNAFD